MAAGLGLRVRRERYRGGGVFHFDERSARFCEGDDEPVVLQAVGIDFAGGFLFFLLMQNKIKRSLELLPI
jgi:hypothetical protein